MQALYCSDCGWSEKSDDNFGMKPECPTCTKYKGTKGYIRLLRGSKEEVEKYISDAIYKKYGEGYN